MSDFGKLLKNLRLSVGLSQKQLAKKLFLSKTMISYYEQSVRFPSADVLVQIADVFHVSVDYLLGREKKERTLDISGLSDKDIAFLQSAVQLLREKNKEADKDKAANV